MQSIATESLTQSGELQNYLDKIRSTSFELFKKGKSEDTIALIQKEIMEKKYAKDYDFSALGDIYLFNKQFVKAEEQYKVAIDTNSSELKYQLKLAHVYLFSNKVSEAKDIHKLYKDNNVSPNKSWITQTKSDFEDFEKRGFPTENFKKILRILE